MSGGIISRLRRWLAPAVEEPSGPRDTEAGRQPAHAAAPPPPPAVDAPPQRAPIEPSGPPAPAVEAPSDPSAEPERAQALAVGRPAPDSQRSLPSFRPVAASEPAAEGPLSVTLSEAIALVQGAGGDVIELRFLRRELDRRTQEGSVPAELWPRIEKAVVGRLRRVGKLAEGQSLVLRRDVERA